MRRGLRRDIVAPGEKLRRRWTSQSIGPFKKMTGRKLLPGKEIPPSEIPDYSIDRRDSSEVYADIFIKRMKILNNFVKRSGEVLEGGIFYWDRDAKFAENLPAADLAPARRNLWRATQVQEIHDRDRRQRLP